LAPETRALAVALLERYVFTVGEAGPLMLALRSSSRLERLEAAIEAALEEAGGADPMLLAAVAREGRLALSAWQTLRLEK
jgi:hypothetical protein